MAKRSHRPAASAHRRPAKSAAHPPSRERAILRVLLPVDGSQGSLRAVDHVIQSYQRLRPAQVHLLNVQSPIPLLQRWRSRRAEIAAQQHAAGLEALQTARARLDAAGIAYAQHVVVGPAAQSIVGYARRWNCDVIIIGTRGLGRTPRLVLGSVATKVIRLAKHPVTLVN